MRLADDYTVDADPPRHNPLFGTTFRRIRILPQQPIQQGLGVSFNHISNHEVQEPALDPHGRKVNALREKRRHFKSDFRLRSRDKVERVAMSRRRFSKN